MMVSKVVNSCKHIFLLGLLVFSGTKAIGPLNSFGVGAVPKCEASLTTASGSYVSHKGIFN